MRSPLVGASCPRSLARGLVRRGLVRGLLCAAVVGGAVVGGLLGCSSSEQVREEDESSPPVATPDTASQNAASQDAASQDAASQDTTASKTQEEKRMQTRLVMVMNPGAVEQEIREQVDGWLGVPYKWGGDSKQGVDCSGFVQAIYKQVFDWLLPRVTEQQVRKGRRIRPNQLRAGDLVFFQPENEYNHSGIYLGENKFVHASSSEGVTIASLKTRYWQRYYWTSRRLLRPSRVPDTLKAELLTYQRVPDSTASSDQVLSDKDEFPVPSRIDTSRIGLARRKDETSQGETSQGKTSQGETEQPQTDPGNLDPSSSTPTLDSMSTAADTTERTGW